jgi:Flp pilus assembly protein TadG
MRRISDRTRRRRRSRSGQSLVELALMLPLIALILLGTLDLARMFFAYEQLTNAVKEGALYAGREPSAATATVDPSNIVAVVRSEGSIGSSLVNITVTCYSGLNGAAIPCAGAAGTTYAGSQDTIVVSAQYQFRPITTQIIRLLPSNYMLRKSVRTLIL